MHLHRRLSSDFTLFNLNDPQTTKFYVSNIDYFISNFPYFKDISILTQYFTVKNPKFNSKFQTRIIRFLEIIKYDSSGGEDSVEVKGGSFDLNIEFKEACVIRESHPVVKKDTTEEVSDEAKTLDKIQKTGLEHKKPSSLINIKSTPMYPNHCPKGNEFVRNPTSLVMKCYAKIISFYLGGFVITSRYIKQIIEKLEYDDIRGLLGNLVKYGDTASTIVKNNLIKDIMHKSFESLEIVMNSVMQGDINSNKDEERLLEQIAENVDYIMDVFMEDGNRYLKMNLLESSLERNKASDLNSDLLNDSTDKKINSTNTELSDTATEKAECYESSSLEDNKETDEQDQKTANACDSTNEKDVACGKNGSLDEEDKILEYQPFVFPTAYAILSSLFSNSLAVKSPLKIREFRIVSLNRFTLQCLRLLAYNESHISEDHLVYLISLVLRNSSNSHFLVSLTKIILKMPPSCLMKIGFFKILRNWSYIFVACKHDNSSIYVDLRDDFNVVFYSQPVANNNMPEGSNIKNLLDLKMEKVYKNNIWMKKEDECSIFKIYEDGNEYLESYEDCKNEDKRIKSDSGFKSSNFRIIHGDTLFAFLIKIYVKFSDFIKQNCQNWRDFSLIMDQYIKFERFRYNTEDLKHIQEYEGFERYVIDCLVSSVPYSTAFTEYPLQ